MSEQEVSKLPIEDQLRYWAGMWNQSYNKGVDPLSGEPIKTQPQQLVML